MLKYIFKQEDKIDSRQLQELSQLLVPLFSFSYHFSQSFKDHGNLYFSTRPKWRLFIYDKDELVGSLSLVERKIDKPFILKIGGVGNLGIKESYQRGGLAKQALSEAHGFLKNHNFDISLLFCTEKLKNVYLRAGFIQLKKPIKYINDENKFEEEPISFVYPILITEDKLKKIEEGGFSIGKGSW